MANEIEPIARLINEFSKLPGVGKKTAQRYAYSIIKNSDDNAKNFAEAILNVKKQVKFCEICGNYTDVSPCKLCKTRKNDIICVVKEPKDVLAIDKSNSFEGTYHVLHGTINPMANIGPNDIRIKELLEAKHALQMEKQKVSDERTELNRALREQARKESYIGMVAKQLQNVEPLKFEYKEKNYRSTDNDLLCHITDLHAGIEIDHWYNKFDMSILRERLWKYLDQLFDIQKRHIPLNKSRFIFSQFLISSYADCFFSIFASENSLVCSAMSFALTSPSPTSMPLQPASRSRSTSSNDDMPLSLIIVRLSSTLSISVIVFSIEVVKVVRFLLLIPMNSAGVDCAAARSSLS